MTFCMDLHEELACDCPPAFEADGVLTAANTLNAHQRNVPGGGGVLRCPFPHVLSLREGELI